MQEQDSPPINDPDSFLVFNWRVPLKGKARYLEAADRIAKAVNRALGYLGRWLYNGVKMTVGVAVVSTATGTPWDQVTPYMGGVVMLALVFTLLDVFVVFSQAAKLQTMVDDMSDQLEEYEADFDIMADLVDEAHNGEAHD